MAFIQVANYELLIHVCSIGRENTNKQTRNKQWRERIFSLDCLEKYILNTQNIFEKTRLTMKLIIYFPLFPASIFFPLGLEGKSMLELDSGVRFSPSTALGQQHGL